jgi:hypothetical protein
MGVTGRGVRLLRRSLDAPRPRHPSIGTVGSKFDSPGPFPVTTQSDTATTFYSPAELGSDGYTRYPVVLWGNAGGTAPGWYDPLLRHLASHGFIVAAANSPRPGSGAEMLQGLATLWAWSREPGTRFHGRVDLDNVGSTGHSQGGRGAINAADDPAIRTTAPIQPWPSLQDRPPDGATAMFFAAQTDHIVPPWTVRDSYGGMTAAAGYAELAGGGHLIATGDAGGFRGAVTAWFRWQLMGDPIARRQFVGPEPAMATSLRWSVYESNSQLQALGAEAEPPEAV